MAEGAGPELLADLLARWEAELRARGFPVDAATNPGLAPPAFRSAYSAFGVTPPDELVEWFRWRNGQPLDAPPLAPPFHAIDAESSVRDRALGLTIGYQPGQWHPWVRLGATGRELSMDTRDSDPAPLVRRTVFEVGTEPRPDFSDVRSLCTPVTWYLDALLRGYHRWDSVAQTWIVSRPATVDDNTRLAYL